MQDRPGQFYVVLDETARPFNEKKHARLAVQLYGLSADSRIEALHDIADEGIDCMLKDFEGEQACGEKLNELTEKYYKKCPRNFNDLWPCPKFRETDVILRHFLSDYVQRPPAEIRKLAKKELKIDLDP